MKKIGGFTLIELLIAASIFSVVILSIYSAFQTGILTYRKVDSAFEIYQSARIILNRIEVDLKNSFAYQTDDSRFVGGSPNMEFFSVIDSYKDGNLNTNVSLVKYEFSNGLLKRLETELSSAVKEILFQYAAPPSSPDKPYEWQDIWPSTDTTKLQAQKPTLPLAIKIELSLIEKDNRQKEVGIIKFTRTVSLPLGETSP